MPVVKAPKPHSVAARVTCAASGMCCAVCHTSSGAPANDAAQEKTDSLCDFLNFKSYDSKHQGPTRAYQALDPRTLRFVSGFDNGPL